MTEPVSEKPLPSALHSLLANLPDEYSERIAAIQKIRHDFYAAMASALEQPLNEHLAASPHASAEDARELATTVNLQLRSLGLTIRSPYTQQPSRLVVHTTNERDPNATRFRFNSTLGSAGKPRNYGCLEAIPHLQLMEAPPRVEALSKSFKTTGHDGAVR